MKNGLCIKCQAPTVYEVDTSKYADRGIVISSWKEAGITYFICTTCGFVEEYVLDENKLKKIAESKHHVEPQS